MFNDVVVKASNIKMYLLIKKKALTFIIFCAQIYSVAKHLQNGSTEVVDFCRTLKRKNSVSKKGKHLKEYRMFYHSVIAGF